MLVCCDLLSELLYWTTEEDYLEFISFDIYSTNFVLCFKYIAVGFACGLEYMQHLNSSVTLGELNWQIMRVYNLRCVVKRIILCWGFVCSTDPF